MKWLLLLLNVKILLYWFHISIIVLWTGRVIREMGFEFGQNLAMGLPFGGTQGLLLMS